jgi:3-deoxy-D-manno-octulosonate 8-phosphate phosphatase KdsC-like HAD superfamily phosphatase
MNSESINFFAFNIRAGMAVTIWTNIRKDVAIIISTGTINKVHNKIGANIHNPIKESLK